MLQETEVKVSTSVDQRPNGPEPRPEGDIRGAFNPVGRGASDEAPALLAVG